MNQWADLGGLLLHPPFATRLTVAAGGRLQGALGDCWLLAAIAAVAEFPQFISDELYVTKCLDGADVEGKYVIKLYDAAKSAWEEVRPH